jgi:pimeloyl-ACP methyl ester carboxylesterase
MPGLPSMNCLSTIAPREGYQIIVEGRRIHYLDEDRDHANRTAVVLLHGCGSLAEEIEAPFTGINARLVAPDRPGYGLSTPLPRGKRSAKEQAQWLGAFFDALGLREAVVVAHSIGAAAALHLAAHRPDQVRSLLLLAPFCRPTPKKAMPLLRAAVTPFVGPIVVQNFIAPFAEILGRRSARFAFHPNPVSAQFSFPFRHAVSKAMIETMADELLSFNVAMNDLGELPPDLPIAVLHGEKDQTAIPGWHLPWLFERHRNTEVHLVRGVGHMPHYVRSKTARRLLVDLLETVADEGPSTQWTRVRGHWMKLPNKRTPQWSSRHL